MNILLFVSLAILVLTIASAYLVIKLPRAWLLIPALIAFGVFVYFKGPDMLGAPREGYPAHEFFIVDFRVMQKDGARFIEAWLFERGADDTRLWKMPYSEALAGQLKELQDGQGKGAFGKFRMKGQPGQPGDGTPYYGMHTDGPQLDVIKPVNPEPLKGSDDDDQ